MRNLESQLKTIENLLRRKNKVLEISSSIKHSNFLLMEILKELNELPNSKLKQIPGNLKEKLLNPEVVNSYQTLTFLLIDIIKWKYSKNCSGESLELL